MWKWFKSFCREFKILFIGDPKKEIDEIIKREISKAWREEIMRK